MDYKGGRFHHVVGVFCCCIDCCTSQFFIFFSVDMPLLKEAWSIQKRQVTSTDLYWLTDFYQQRWCRLLSEVLIHSEHGSSDHPKGIQRRNLHVHMLKLGIPTVCTFVYFLKMQKKWKEAAGWNERTCLKNDALQFIEQICKLIL